ncbi:MAG: SPOR domain-containing protein [Desulfovibrio sp.]|nr:SPOR domain-containing protein [Desulfovibrio sp.]
MSQQQSDHPSSGSTSFFEKGIVVKPLSLLGVAVVLCLAIALAYVGGVMSGRKSVSCDVPPLVGQEVAQAPSPKENEEFTSVLQPEELEFSRRLRNEQDAPKSQVQPPQPRATAQQAREARPVPQPSPPPARPEGTGNGAPTPPEGVVLPVPGRTTAEETAAVPSLQNPESSALLYDYCLQVCAVRNEESADALRQRLEGQGMRTFLKREGKLFLVQVRFRGNEARKRELEDVLTSMRLGRPVQISQKPVAR